MLAFLITIALAAPPAESPRAKQAWCNAFNVGFASRGEPQAVNPYESPNERDGWENARSYRGWASPDWREFLPRKAGGHLIANVIQSLPWQALRQGGE